MEEKILQAVRNSQGDFLKDLQNVMQVESVKGQPEPDAPFGHGPKKALIETLKLAESYGLRTEVLENGIGYAELGSAKEYIAAVGHLDVVSAGSGWDYPPFDLSEEKGVLYGRGILDNKGPIFSCLYATKILKELNVPLKKSIRIIFGTDEESGSADLPLYLKNEPEPVFAFTPDCKYPVVYGERGIVNVAIHTKMKKESLISMSIEGDQAKDHVPDELLLTYQGKKYSFKGKRSPSNAPELGENALTLLADTLKETPEIPKEVRSYFSWLSHSFHEKHFGEGIDLALKDVDSGKLILTPYQLKICEREVVLEVAFRYPVSYQEQEILNGLKKALSPDSTLEIIRSIKGSSYDKYDPNIQLLSKVYEDLTGLDGTPVTTTGATYARSFPNTIAFGPSFPGQKGIAHNKNEYMSISDLMKNFEIYTLSLYKLANKAQ